MAEHNFKMGAIYVGDSKLGRLERGTRQPKHDGIEPVFAAPMATEPTVCEPCFATDPEAVVGDFEEDDLDRRLAAARDVQCC